LQEARHGPVQTRRDALSREHLRLGPKLAPRFLGRQQPAARRNPNPAASLPPVSESPQQRKASIKPWARLRKTRRVRLAIFVNSVGLTRS
jgi:hypothetical protein